MSAAEMTARVESMAMAARSDSHLLEAGWVAEWRERFRAALTSSLVDEFVPFAPAHPSLRDEYILHCPCCHKKVQILEQQSLLKLQRKRWLAEYVEAQQYSNTPKSSDKVNQQWLNFLKSYPWSRDSDSWIEWACDTCISSHLAEFADFEIVYILAKNYDFISRPYFYFDQMKICHVCQKQFAYTAGEQRWANEILVISEYSSLSDCKSCRLEKRERNRIAPLIHLTRIDPDPFPYLEIVTDLMLRFNNPRALLYLRRAKNKAPTVEKRREYEARIALLERAR